MPRRYVAALVKHETNTFSPIATPLSSFGHGEGPAFGRAAAERFRGTNTPLAAYLDLAARERAEIVTPVAAESWPSGAATRATFEALVRPIEDAVRAGCDAVFLDLHGAMVIDDCDDPEGEIARRTRAVAPGVPIAVTLDYHTNLGPELVDNTTVIAGYKTYPHVDMYEPSAFITTSVHSPSSAGQTSETVPEPAAWATQMSRSPGADAGARRPLTS